jgi:hypothetical protein
MAPVQLRFDRMLRGAFHRSSYSVTLGALFENTDPDDPSAQVVGAVAVPFANAGQLGTGTAVPVHTICWMPEGSPVLSSAPLSACVAGLP